MRVWKFGDDINTDIITPGRYTMTTDKDRLGSIAFIEYRPEFTKEVSRGDIIVAGKNFGCGSSREHSPLAIKAAGIGVVVAESFARIFLRNSINIGLPIIVCVDTSSIVEGDDVSVDLSSGVIINHTRDMELQGESLPEFIQNIVRNGGLINFLRGDGYV